MKNGYLILVLMLGFGLMLSTVAMAEGAASGKPLTSIQFAERFHGLDSKLVDRQYADYRSGTIPLPTLDSSSMR